MNFWEKFSLSTEITEESSQLLSELNIRSRSKAVHSFGKEEKLQRKVEQPTWFSLYSIIEWTMDILFLSRFLSDGGKPFITVSPDTSGFRYLFHGEIKEIFERLNTGSYSLAKKQSHSREVQEREREREREREGWREKERESMRDKERNLLK